MIFIGRCLGVLALFFTLSLQPEAGVRAQDSDGDILDLLPYGTFIRTPPPAGENVFICKEVDNLPLECGDGLGGFVDNFYVIFIDKASLPLDSPLELGVSNNSTFTPISATDCSADSIVDTIVGVEDLPDSLKENFSVPAGQQAVIHRVRVTNGNGSITITARQFCEFN